MTHARISLRVQASARRDELVGIRDGVVLVRVTAPAIEGRANESLRRLLAKRLGLPKSSVTVVRGHRWRDKVVEVDGPDEIALMAALAE